MNEEGSILKSITYDTGLPSLGINDPKVPSTIDRFLKLAAILFEINGAIYLIITTV